MVDAVNPPGLWAPFGAFSQAVIQGQGQVLHLKAQVALDAAGKLVGKGDMRAQVTQVLANMQTLLNAFGGGLSDVVSLLNCTADMDAFMACGDLRKVAFPPPYPVSTTIEVSRFYSPDVLVEIAGVAEIPRERFRRP